VLAAGISICSWSNISVEVLLPYPAVRYSTRLIPQEIPNVSSRKRPTCFQSTCFAGCGVMFATKSPHCQSRMLPLCGSLSHAIRNRGVRQQGQSVGWVLGHLPGPQSSRFPPQDPIFKSLSLEGSDGFRCGIDELALYPAPLNPTYDLCLTFPSSRTNPIDSIYVHPPELPGSR
jgi:hypothetical protein